MSFWVAGPHSLRLSLLRGRIENCVLAGAIVTSSNLYLCSNQNSNYWRFSGKTNIDGAVHAASGPELLQACHMLPIVETGGIRCPIGSAVVTRAYGQLPNDYVIHTVAPDGFYDVKSNASLLKDCFVSVLRLADKLKVDRIAIPAIGCGVQGWPPRVAGSLALEAAIEFGQTDRTSLQAIDLVIGSDGCWGAWSTMWLKKFGSCGYEVELCPDAYLDTT